MNPSHNSSADHYPNPIGTIDIGQIMPGDLIFDWDGRGWAHVTICTKSDTKPMHTHAVYRNIERPGVWETSLRVTGSSRVLRCGDEQLRASAAGLATQWSEYLLPYGFDRKDAAELFDAKPGNENIVSVHRRLFQEKAKFRAIKYAARRNGYLIFPGEQKGGTGLICSSFVALCYQVGGLKPFVKPAASDPMVRVSDKQMSPSELAGFGGYFTQCLFKKGRSGVDWQAYCSYLGNLHESNPYQLVEVDAQKTAARVSKAVRPHRERTASPGIKYHPSIDYWDHDKAGDISAFNWAAHITNGMMLDSKVVTPSALLQCLLADENKVWVDKGELAGPPVPKLTEAEIRERKDAANAARQKVIDKAGAIRTSFFQKK